MLDLLIKSGTVADGTGGDRFAGDIGIRGDRVVAIGVVDEPARQTIDVEGMIVAPGFVDIHTHYDAQVLWDPALTPSCLHGTTTIIGGNCGFTIAPMASEHTDYISRMLSFVEGMPLESLGAGVSYAWKTFGEYLDTIENRVGVNAGFFAGHSTIRRFVMGDAAVGQVASASQIEAMQRVLAESISGGAFGFSSSVGGAHFDGSGDPVPSRAATVEEIVALSSVVGTFEGTSLGFIPGAGGTSRAGIELMIEMSRVANRRLNWNVLIPDVDAEEKCWEEVRAADEAAALGARVLALVPSDALENYLSFKTGFVLAKIPGWTRIMTAPPAEKLRAFSDPVERQRLGKMAEGHRDWADMRVIRSRNADYQGRRIQDIAQERRLDAYETLIDMVVADDLETLLLPTSPRRGGGLDDASWKLRGELWRDPRVIVGATDAGAHVDSITTFSYGTSVLRAAREHSLMSTEMAVHLLADRPARYMGLRDRGRIQLGWFADLIVFDEETVTNGSPFWREDLPGGAGRLFSDPVGVSHVIVNGREIVRENCLTGELPGRVMRSGVDTEAVRARPAD